MKPEHIQTLKNLVTKAYADPSGIRELSLSEVTVLIDALEETEQEELKKCEGTPHYTQGETVKDNIDGYITALVLTKNTDDARRIVGIMLEKFSPKGKKVKP